MDLGNLFGGGGSSNQPLTQYDPQVAAIRNQALGQYNDLYKQIGDASSGYVQSAVNPVIASNAMEYGNQLQGQGIRGIRGSSFGDASLQNTINAGNQNVSDATMKALMQVLGAKTGITGGVAGLGNALAQQNLGLGNLNNQITQANQANSQANAGLFGGLMGGINSLLGGSSSGLGSIGNLFGMGGGGGGGVDAAALAQFLAMG